jgi:hypothetical protein
VLKAICRHWDSSLVYQSTLANVRGMVFLATPHVGSNWATILDAIPGTSPIVACLKAFNEDSGHLQSDFMELSQRQNWSPKALFELKGMVSGSDSVHLRAAHIRHSLIMYACGLYRHWQSIMGKIVPAGSGMGGFHQPLGIEADHVSIAKPAKKEAQTYLAIQAYIKEVLVPNRVSRS